MRDFTDSFCERCGTRYTFGPPPAKGPSLATAKILAKGLKNFVMNDSTTMDEAMAAARIDEERAHSSQVTEDFHRIFNFCMTCRQYACDKCWNPNQGACLSCAPLWDEEPVAPKDHLILRTPKVSRGPAAGQGAAAEGALLGQPTLEELMASAASAREPQPERRRGRKQAPEPAEAPAFEAPPATPVTPATPVAPAPQPTVAERRAAVRDQKAAQELRAQSEAWQTQEDGWSLWPSEAGRAAEAAPQAEAPAAQAAQAGGLNLTDEEYLLVQSELDHPSPYVEPDEQTASRVAPPRRREARGPKPVEPPAAQPSLDFDIIGSLRQPAVGEESQPAAPAKPQPAPHPGTGQGRLLGPHDAHAARPAAGPAGSEPPAPPRAAKAHKPARAAQGHQATEAATSPWPNPTLWSQRPIERHDYWSESDALAAAGSAQPLGQAERPLPFDQGLPQQLEEPAPWPPQPVPSAQQPFEPLAAEVQAEQPLPSTPPAAPVRRPAQRSQPQRPLPAEPQTQWPEAAEATDGWAVQGAGEEQPVWPPIGAPVPATRQPVAPWPVEDQTLTAASVVAARSQADHAVSDAAAQVEAMWVESAQNVLSQGSVRACRHCALPLSTHARFCRRCGADQQG
jgi:hypothetical protein